MSHKRGKGGSRYFSTPSLTENAVVENLNNETFSTVAKAGGNSDVWDSYDVVNPITSAAVDYVRCHKCESLFKHNSSTGVSSLKRHADCQKRAPGDRSKSNNELKKRMTKLCVEMCARDCRPFNTGAAGEGFKKLAQGLVDIGAKVGNVDATDLPVPTSRNVRTVTDTESCFRG